jgi:hypothetical protein
MAQSGRQEMNHNTFTALQPDGERVELRVRRDEPPPEARSKGPLERWERAQRRLIKARERGAELFRHYLAKAAEVKADHDVSEDPKHAPAVEHHASKIADLLVESGRHPNRAAALDHLLHSARGAALLRRLHKQEDTSMSDNWTSIAKDHGIVAVAKFIVEDGAHVPSEGEFTALVTEFAKKAHPSLTPDQAFSRVFSADTPEAALLRQACAACKAWPAPISISPTMVGGSDAFPTVTRRPGSSAGRKTDPADGLGTAYEQLTRLAESQRRAGESASQAFARIYADPANRHLADAERAESRPSASVRVVE